MITTFSCHNVCYWITVTSYDKSLNLILDLLFFLYNMNILFVCLFCCFTSQVNSYGHGGTVSSPNLTFPGQAWTSSLPVLCAHTFACNWQQPFLNDSAEGRRKTIEIISWSISTKVWDRAGIKLATPGSAVRLTSIARQVADCATRPGYI